MSITAPDPTQTNNEPPDASRPISKLNPQRIPMPFAANDHMIPSDDMPGLIAALALKGAKPRI